MGTERKGETKRQHYVPRMILRNFSRDRRRISLLVDGKRIDGASIGKQCYEDYFYGADNIMEKSFAEEEGKVNAFLGDLDPERFKDLNADDAEMLRYFIYYQHARTRGAAEHLSKFAGAFAKEMVRGSLRLRKDPDLSPEALDEVEIGLKNAQNEALWQATKTTPIIKDLNVKFITTARTPGFVIGDHPVVVYNQFVEHHPVLSQYPVSTGLALKGIQLFMPLSPSVTLALYDPSTYEYGGKSSSCTAGPKDVDYLNRMQAINAHSCVYFHEDRVDDGALAGLCAARATHPSIYAKKAAVSEMRRKPDGKVGQFIVVTHEDLRIGAKMSFIRSNDGHSYLSYRGASPPVRSERMIELTMQYGEMLEGMVRARKAERDREAGVPPRETQDE